MGANMKHFTKEGEHKGETHKMNGELHTGAKHSDSSKVLSHKPGGPFKMNTSPFDTKKGLWANIHAKKKRGETMRSKGDEGAPTEKAIEDSQN